MCLIRVVQCSNPMFPTQGEPSCLSPLAPLPRSLQVSARRVWGRRGSRCQDCSEFSLKGPLKSGSHFMSAILCQPQSAISPTLSRTGIGVGVGGRVGTNSHTPPPICPPPRVWGWLGEGEGGISPDMAKLTTFHSLPPKRQFHASASLGKFLWDV